MSKSNIVISRESISRLIKDITYIRKNPLIDNGIHYIHDEVDMLKGYALIIGPKDTPYFGGFYLFEFVFPYDYPFSPPKVLFLTNDGNIRFNPNLYKNGKVCVSILNTWAGDQWSSCQTLNSILLTLCTLLNDNPLLNEPGIRTYHPDCEKYKKLINYSNINIAICGMINKKYLPNSFELFYPIIKESFLQNYESILAYVETNIDVKEEISVQVYNMRIYTDYNLIKKELIKCYNEIKEINENL
jgi:ubiquitin-conjugating enzyme E2 Z